MGALRHDRALGEDAALDGRRHPAEAAIEAAIRTTDFTALRSHPFTGECPTAWDGQEIVYGFATPAGSERVASCEVAIDDGTPLFAAVSAALGPFLPLPTT